MRELNEIECFVKAVELKSLTAAAKALKLPTSQISRKIKNLEERVSDASHPHVSLLERLPYQNCTCPGNGGGLNRSMQH